MAAAQIKAQFQRALANCTQTEQILTAWAQLDYADTAAWLIAEEQSARRSCTAGTLTKLFDMIIAAGLAEKNAAFTKTLVSVARLYADVLSPDAAAAFAWTLPPEQRSPAVRELVGTALRRAPQHPRLLRVASEMAVECDDVGETQRLLTELGKADDSPATINYIYRTRAKLASSEGPHVRAAFLSSFTIDSLVPYVDLELRKLGLVPEFYVAPFNSWAQEIMDENSHFRRFDPEIAFLAVAIDDLVPELAGSPSISLLEQKGRAVADHLIEVIESFAAWSSATLVIHSFHSPYRSPQGILESRIGRTRFGWLNELNSYVAERLHALPRAFLLDMNELLLHRRGGNFDNAKMRYLARMRLGDRVLSEVACAYARYVGPLKGLRRKCVVLDLDNTLWGGIVGEDGPHGVKLGDTAPGIEYQDFQRYLLSLTERGFLLAINSKNNPEDALAVIRSHEGMVLREDAFSAIRINWRPKTENMASIAEELNIGLDSMVFLDDNPDERELMRQVFPEVLTPELPPDPSLYRCSVELLPQLQSLVVTKEDESRVQQYRSKRQRDQVRARAQSLEEYLLALEISVQISRASDETLSRLHQLFERTNQFNLTTRRYTIAQLAVFARDPGWRFYTLRARDRFGEHGLVAAALVRIQSQSWTVDSFIMSCRVIGYGVETALLAVISEGAAGAGAATLVGEYSPTAKNAPARDFYSRHGFTEEGTVDGVTRFHLTVGRNSVSRAGWINIVITDAT